MGKEFKILYWNIHFKEGSGKEISLRNSSIIINDIINKYDTEIDAIVFTEAYPQLNNKNDKYEKYNTMILDHLKNLGIMYIRMMHQIITNQKNILIRMKKNVQMEY